MIKCEKKPIGEAEGNFVKRDIECLISGGIRDIFAEYAAVRRAVFEHLRKETDERTAEFILDQIADICTKDLEEFGARIDALALVYADIAILSKKNGGSTNFFKSFFGGGRNL